MAVEGAHDSNIYISERVTSFQLLAPNDLQYNDLIFTFTEKSVFQYASSETPSITINNVFFAETTILSGVLAGNAVVFYFDKNEQGNWEIKHIRTRDDGHPITGSVTVSFTSTPDDPTEIDFSNALNDLNDASINVLTRSIRKLNSIQNISFSQNVQETPALVVGQNISPTTIDGPTQTTVSVDKILNNDDFIRTLVGLSNIYGEFEYGDNFLSFNKTCLNNFSVSATINELPQASFDFTIYGSLSGTSTSVASNVVSDNTTEEITPEGLLVTFDKQSTNAVQSFNYSEVINKQATYGIGSNEPSDIQTVGPILQEASIAIEVEDYEPEETFSFLSGSKDRNRTIKMEISGESSILNTFQLENGYLVSESVGVGVGGTTVANLKYRGYKKSVLQNFTVKGRVGGNANSATFSNGSVIGDDVGIFDLIAQVTEGSDLILTYTSQNDFDELIINGTYDSAVVNDTTFQIYNIRSNIKVTIVRTD